MKQLPLRLHTYTVSELGEDLRAFLGEAFPGVWVRGEVQRLKPSRNGHLFFELVEKGEGDTIIGKLEAVIWRADAVRLRRELAATGQQLAEGMEVRCMAAVDFYPPAGRLQASVRELDAIFSLGLLARRRRETLEALGAAGLLERNRSLSLTPVPVRLGLVTSHDSAAFHDFLSYLRESRLRFEVLLVHAAVQGPAAEREVASALRVLAGLAVDCVVLVRGGGAKSDLAAFDSRRIAEAIAGSPVPVLTGLGHEIDRSVADLVAHTALKTPTMVAEFLVRRVEAAERQLNEVGQRLCRGAVERLRGESEALGAARARALRAADVLAAERARGTEAARLLAAIAGQRLGRGRDRLERARSAVRASSPRIVRRRGRERDELAERLVRAARAQLRGADGRCDGLTRVATQLAPERVLARGFSITRTAAGAVVRRAEQVALGDQLVTKVAGGSLVGRVETITVEER